MSMMFRLNYPIQKSPTRLLRAGAVTQSGSCEASKCVVVVRLAALTTKILDFGHLLCRKVKAFFNLIK